MQYKSLYEYGMECLNKAGVEEYILDARVLLEYVCKTDRNTLLVHPGREVSPEEEKLYRDYIAKRSERIPLQHITGTQDFMGLTFKVNNQVLIPRQDTEILVEEALKELRDGMRILDMCTGSGCILLSLLHYSNDCSGVGVDVSEGALQVAKENAEALQCEHQASFVESDLFAQVRKEPFDLIVSNPPYIATDVIETLMPEVKDHEPMKALDGKKDGLFFYRKIVAEGWDFLRPGGYMFFEIGYDQAEAVSGLMEKQGFRDVRVVKDFASLDRVVGGYKPVL